MSLKTAKELFGLTEPAALREFDRFEEIETTWQDGKIYSKYRAEREHRAQAISPEASAVETVAKDNVDEPQAKFAGEVVRQVIETESAVDGINLYYGSPAPSDSGSAQLIITPLDQLIDRYPGQRLTHPEFFRAAGYLLPGTAEQLIEIQQQPITSKLIRLLNGPKSIIVSTKVQRPTQVGISALDREHPTRVVLSDAEHCAMIKHEVRDAAGNLIRATSCSKFRSIEGRRIELPTKITVDHFALEGRESAVAAEVLLTDTYTLIDLSTQEWPITRFRLSEGYTEVGTYIADRSIPEAAELPNGQIDYRIPADPAQLDAVIARAKRGAGVALGTGITAMKWSVVRLSAIAATVFAIVVLVGLLIRRRRLKNA